MADEKQLSIDDFEDYTLGLWVLKGEIFNDMEIYAAVDGFLIAGLWSDPEGSWRETLANFRLMAAAPQLLKLAKELRSMVKSVAQEARNIEEHRNELQARVAELETELEATTDLIERNYLSLADEGGRQSYPVRDIVQEQIDINRVLLIGQEKNYGTD